LIPALALFFSSQKKKLKRLFVFWMEKTLEVMRVKMNESKLNKFNHQATLLWNELIKKPVISEAE